MSGAKAPQLYVIAGPNGAGKTTFARVYLPHLTKVFINADLIASAGGGEIVADDEALLEKIKEGLKS